MRTVSALFNPTNRSSHAKPVVAFHGVTTRADTAGSAEEAESSWDWFGEIAGSAGGDTLAERRECDEPERQLAPNDDNCERRARTTETFPSRASMPPAQLPAQLVRRRS